MLVTTLAYATNPNLFRSLPYDSERDFTPIGMIGLTPLVLRISRAGLSDGAVRDRSAVMMIGKVGLVGLGAMGRSNSTR